MNEPEPEVLVRETYLSHKPAEGSGLAAAAGLLVLAGVSLLSWSDYSGIARLLPASGEQVFGQGQYWRLVTSMFVHADLRHLLSNAPGVAGLGYLLYGYFGGRVYPCLMLAAGLAVTLVALSTYPPHISLLGASGVVYQMAGFWLTLYVGLERRHAPGRRLLRAAGFLLVVLVPTSFSPEISYRTHAIGFGVGVLAATLYFAVHKTRLRRAEVVETDWE